MYKKVPNLFKVMDVFTSSKETILIQWISYPSTKEILKNHQITENIFITKYASNVFDYYMEVVSGKSEIGFCPSISNLLSYLKYREISSDELFEICNNFRCSLLDFTYNTGLDYKIISDDISYVYDKNFRGVLKLYTDTIFEKLIDARQKALKAGEAKEYFLSNMSHEIRTPLNAILGFVNLLIDENISDKHRSYLEIILNSGENLLNIINDILDFSKLRSGEFTIEPKIFSLHEEISHTMELFVASANSKNITIASFIDPIIPKELYGDALRIKQILSNFLSNAIKFTPEHGLINVEVFYKDGMLHISVKDNGIGIQENDIKNIFTAFAQAKFNKYSNNGGTGLGLSICSQLAQLMGGFVHVESIVGNGSKFWMEIPIDIHTNQYQIVNNIKEFQKLKMVLYAKDKITTFRHESFYKYANIFNMNIEIVDNLDGDFDVALFIYEELDEYLQEKIIKSNKKYIALMSKLYDVYDNYENITQMCFPLYRSKIEETFHKLFNENEYLPYNKKLIQRFNGHILVAEDNVANQELIKIILTKYGLSFDMVSNGLEAVQKYKLYRYDLILMDEQMPIMDGNEAVKNILEYEKQKHLRHTPISALTANVIKGARERGLLSGFDAFLGKPIVIKDVERVFFTYLAQETVEIIDTEKQSLQTINIEGLDVKKLTKELILTNEELIMLLKLFLSKMNTTIPELKNAIKDKDYKNIALISHSIKGASGNFRIEILQNLAGEIESMAKNQNKNYDYEKNFNIIKERVEQIRIND